MNLHICIGAKLLSEQYSTVLIIVDAVEDMPVLAVARVGKYYRTTIPREVYRLLELLVILTLRPRLS